MIISPEHNAHNLRDMGESTSEEERKELADATNLPSPNRKKRRIQRGKTVRAMFPNAKFAKKTKRMKKTKTHKERRERLKKKARAPNTNKGLMCYSENIKTSEFQYLQNSYRFLSKNNFFNKTKIIPRFTHLLQRFVCGDIIILFL